jgi:hypothetical protein
MVWFIATFRRKIGDSERDNHLLEIAYANSYADFPPRHSFVWRVSATTSLSPLHSKIATYLDNVVGDHSKANPSLHTFKASVPASIQSMTTLQHADAAFASGPPTLPGAKPTRSLQSSPLAAFGAPARHRDSRYAHSLDGLFIL